MQLDRKMEIIQSSILSMSTHSDEDAAVRVAGLNAVIEFCESEKTRVNVEATARAEELFGSDD